MFIYFFRWTCCIIFVLPNASKCWCYFILNWRFCPIGRDFVSNCNNLSKLYVLKNKGHSMIKDLEDSLCFFNIIIISAPFSKQVRRFCPVVPSPQEALKLVSVPAWPTIILSACLIPWIACNRRHGRARTLLAACNFFSSFV